MADREYSGRERSGRAVEIRVAAQLNNLGMLRAIAAAVGAFERLDDDGVADLRLAVDEACTCLIRLASSDAPLTVVVDPTDVDLAVEVLAPCADDQFLSPGTFSWYVLSSLADQVETFHDGVDQDDPDWKLGIRLTTRRVGSVRWRGSSTL